MSGLDDTSYTQRTSAATTNVLTNQDYVLILASLTGATAVTLPNAALVQPGRMYIVYKDASAQTVTVTPASGTIDGGASTTLASGAAHAKTFIGDGANWETLTAY
jgi:hypothetical protein